MGLSDQHKPIAVDLILADVVYQRVKAFKLHPSTVDSGYIIAVYYCIIYHRQRPLFLNEVWAFFVWSASLPFLLSWRWTCAAPGNRGILFLWLLVGAYGPRLMII